MTQATLDYIGTIRTPYHSLEQCPNNIQPDGPDCQLILSDRYVQGLEGLKAGDDILVLYWLAQGRRNLVLQNGAKNQERGVFSLRSPHRPNPIGAAVVPIDSLQNGIIVVKGLDCLDNTPIIDIKPAIYREK
ncbi:hypothetical protein VII00023_22306 [Vibrio ichthyoenteri ATCC 700023]|uniref:TsaA-like domain-containing protein n=1 Tax=Vibrio ichthyoenteri ATCC 700023 TaxID=870968 RepID=F9S6Z5_9VIBR|nr:tRNA (N6-threonylcarbamoyladenosine(37)-N6)-methyltransferase TrmO [Vibrio ichthyoenteri]EGU32142.1 hypothetical protein VII00023_22306 [Vibrio ichthyoenteri ATCC 700023]